MKHLGKMIPLKSRKLLVEGLLMSKLLYAISQWGGAGPTMLITAQRLQNKLARWTTGLSRRTKTASLLEALDWFSIQELVRIHTSTQPWKIIHMNKPETIRQKLQIADDMTVQIPPTRLQLTMNSFLARASTDWNLLPPHIRNMKSLPTFKKSLKKWIKDGRTLNPD